MTPFPIFCGGLPMLHVGLMTGMHSDIVSIAFDCNVFLGGFT